MAMIRVNMKAVLSETEKLKDFSTSLHRIEGSINAIKNRIPDKVLNKKNLYNRLNVLIRKLANIEERVNSVKVYSEKSMLEYTNLEARLKREAETNLYGLKR